MGVDALSKFGKSFERTRRQAVDDFAGPNLFSGAASFAVHVVAHPVCDHLFVEGQDYLVRLVDGRVVVAASTRIVGYVVEPEESVLAMLRGAACDHAIARVVRVFRTSGLAEMALE